MKLFDHYNVLFVKLSLYLYKFDFILTVVREINHKNTAVYAKGRV